MRALRFILHSYSYLFHLLLALFLLGIALVAALVGNGSFDLPMIPWVSSKSLVPFLLIATTVGIAAVALAVLGKVRALFTVWTLFVLATVIWGFFLSSYSYAGMDEFRGALWMLAGAAVAAVGGVSQLKPLKP